MEGMSGIRERFWMEDDVSVRMEGSGRLLATALCQLTNHWRATAKCESWDSKLQSSCSGGKPFASFV